MALSIIKDGGKYCLVSYKDKSVIWLPISVIVANYPQLWIDYSFNPKVTGSE
jgi:hypothetical protein